MGGIEEATDVNWVIRVSSRAPVWGASDVAFDIPIQRDDGFKSCPRVGGIFIPAAIPVVYIWFQVVPPCGGHLEHLEPPNPLKKFQVVPPCGGHLFSFGYSAGSSWFQVVPPCGGHPRKRLWGILCCFCFKSCPRVGGISCNSAEICNQISFKSCPRVGGIKARYLRGKHRQVSSRAPVWGASIPNHAGFVNEQVSSRAPVWGASFVILIRPSLSKVSSRAPVWGASVNLHKKHVANLCKICIFLPNCRF